jgi:hypothetical protein
MGDTPNIAARVQGLAAPDAVVISAATYRLTQGFFTCRELGPQLLKGISAPVEAYQVFEGKEVCTAYVAVHRFNAAGGPGGRWGAAERRSRSKGS